MADAISKSIVGIISIIVGYTNNQDSIENEMRIDKIVTSNQQDAAAGQHDKQIEHMICTNDKTEQDMVGEDRSQSNHTRVGYS